MDTETARDLLTDFKVEYGEDATLHLLATDDDDTAHIEVRGPAIKVVVASDVDNEAARLFAYAPELAAALIDVTAERHRLARILAVERGDETQASAALLPK